MSERKTFDDQMSARRPWARLQDRGRWIDGEVATPHGFVTVYHQWDENPHARFDFIWRGRLYMRTISGRVYSKRGLAIVAAKFAKEIATA